MMKFLALAFFIGLTSAATIHPMAIKPKVEDIVQCGGDGELLEARLPGCTNQPCHIIVGTEYNVEFDFITGEQGSTDYRIKVVAIGITLIEEVIQGDFTPNTGYTVSFTVTASNQLEGLTVTLRATVDRESDPSPNNNELCAEIRVRVTAAMLSAPYIRPIRK